MEKAYIPIVYEVEINQEYLDSFDKTFKASLWFRVKTWIQDLFKKEEEYYGFTQYAKECSKCGHELKVYVPYVPEYGERVLCKKCLKG